MSPSPAGLDLDIFASWFGGGPWSAELIAGGKSNLTYLVTDGTKEYVVRRPPLGHVLATAHDMGREFRVMSALQNSIVPVPRMIRECTGPDVFGAPLYVMERVEGVAIRSASELDARGPERTKNIINELTDTLVNLHSVDYRAVGLADFGRPEGYVARQVKRWKKQLESSTSRPLAGVDELIGYLDSTSPVSQEATIVHGDFRLDNALVDENDHITAVLDWEMSTLGDPLSDVALMLVYQQMAMGGARAGNVSDTGIAKGHPTIDEVIERYVKGSGRDASDLGYYLALNFFKLAVILEGIHFRFTQGKTVGEGFAGIGELVVPLIDSGLAHARRS